MLYKRKGVRSGYKKPLQASRKQLVRMHEIVTFYFSLLRRWIFLATTVLFAVQFWRPGANRVGYLVPQCSKILIGVNEATYWHFPTVHLNIPTSANIFTLYTRAYSQRTANKATFQLTTMAGIFRAQDVH